MHMHAQTPTVFIVDDDAAIRDAITMLLRQEGFTVKAFDSGETFLASGDCGDLGCAIVDMRMPGMDGLALQHTMLAKEILLPVIFLSGHGDIPLSVKAIKAGAVDFLTKPVTRDKLLAAVKTAIAIAEKNAAEHASRLQAKSRLAALTERECEVTALAVIGYSNKEIARRLGISHRTVEIHKSNIMHKTAAINLLDLARIAHDGGLIDYVASTALPYLPH